MVECHVIGFETGMDAFPEIKWRPFGWCGVNQTMHDMVEQETRISNRNGTFFYFAGTFPAGEHIDGI